MAMLLLFEEIQNGELDTRQCPRLGRFGRLGRARRLAVRQGGMSKALSLRCE